MFLYIIVCTKSTVKKNIGENCFCELEEDRYHETDCDKWKPYKNCPTIANILSNFNKYPIKKSELLVET